MKHAKPKVIWLAGADAGLGGQLGTELQRLCRAHSIPAMLVDEFQVLPGKSLESNGPPACICRLAKSLAEQGYPVIVAAAHQQESSLVWNRAHLPGYFEVHVADGIGEAAPVAPDMRIPGLQEDRGGVYVQAEAIFEEVFGRGQLLPCLDRQVTLPGAGLLHSAPLSG